MSVYARDKARVLSHVLGLHLGPQSEVVTMKQAVRARDARDVSRVPSQDSLHEVEARHRALETRLTELRRRAYLTPGEQREATELKKRKLAAKDQLSSLGRPLP